MRMLNNNIFQVAEETAHLAPHGVPSNPLPRGLSSNKLQDLATENHGYGATHTSGPNLNIPQGKFENIDYSHMSKKIWWY